MPGHVRWVGVIPMEGLAGRIVGDVLIHYLNLAGAYIVCATVLAVALYLTTAFSFSALQLWAPTRFAFVVALWNRYKDWQDGRAKKKMQKELEKRRATRPTITAQLVPARPAATHSPAYEPARVTGIDRMNIAERGEDRSQENRSQEDRSQEDRRQAVAASRIALRLLFRMLKLPSGPTPEPSQRQPAAHRGWRFQIAAEQSVAIVRTGNRPSMPTN